MEERLTHYWQIPSRTQVGVENLAEHILEVRGINHEEFLSIEYQDLGDPYKLPDMTEAVDHLLKVRQDHEKLAIYGDYDIDGLTATALLRDALKVFGFDVACYIPDRFVEGYGLHTDALKKLKMQGINTVVTVDCGITATEPIAWAAQNNLKIIVTDHHKPSDDEPIGAVALINPRRVGNTYPDNNLAGVGVAFALVRALQKKLPDLMPEGQEKWLLDLVALGTVCDVVPLINENRALVHYGLKVARQSRRAGFKALAQECGLDIINLRAEDFGFKLGPRLNAAGRLEHAKKSLDLLIADDIDTAHDLANQLNILNSQRRQLSDEIYQQALIEAEKYSADAVLVLASPDWSHGVAGLVASRIVDHFGKPTIILQVDNKSAKGSARSVGAFSIIDLLQKHGDLFERFGGHAAAAGMTLANKNIDKLRKAINQSLGDGDYESMKRRLVADCWLEAEYLSVQGLEQIQKLEPVGQANQRVIFYLPSLVESIRYVGQEDQHAQIGFSLENKVERAIAFNARTKWPFISVGQKVELLLVMSENKWRGTSRPQLEVIAARESAIS
jgi:single-stranded-DNA-specific exonuclease